MTDKELKELMAKSAQAHTEILKHCGEELKQSVIVKRRKKNKNKNKNKKHIDSMTQKEYKDALERVNEISAEKAKLEDEISKYRKENYKKMAMECIAMMGITGNVIDVVSCEIISNVDESVDHYRYGIADPYITTKKTECELRIKCIVE